MVITLKFDGELEHQGFRIFGEIREGSHHLTQLGNLPADPELVSILTQHWQNYRQVCAPYQRIRGIQTLGIDYGMTIPQCQESEQQLSTRFQQWLENPSFQPIDQLLRSYLRADKDYQILIATEDDFLYKLPWHQWQLQQANRQPLVIFCPLNFNIVPPINNQNQSHCQKILAILGHGSGRNVIIFLLYLLIKNGCHKFALNIIQNYFQEINVNEDEKELQNRFNEKVEFLREPRHETINDQLWEQSWDIIFFAGHSETEGDKGRIYHNPQESLTVNQLENAMRQAVENGLQLAIFNSCDGIGLIQQLSHCNIPYIIVMRDLIPDQVAHKFLAYFLDNFTQGIPFYLAIQKAQQRLQGLETDFPYASWLPLIYQNPNASPPVWKNSTVEPLWKSLIFLFLCILLSTGIVMGMRWLGWLQGVELIAYDTMIKLRFPELIDPRIVVIEITEKDTSRYQYPIPDDILAKAINKLNLDQPVVVGVDLHRYYPRGKGREKLRELFDKNPQVITVCAFDTQDKNYDPPPEVNPSQLAFSNLMPDDFPLSGQKVRRQLLSYEPKLDPSSSSCIIPYSLSLTLAYSYLKHNNIQPIKTNSENNWQLGETILPRLPARFGGYQDLDGSSQIMINYRYQNLPDMRFRSMKSFTMSDVLDGNIEYQFIKDKIILIGYSSPTAKEYFFTPMGEIPGVWIHAQMTSQVISTVLDKRSLIWAFSQWGDFLLVLGFSTVTTMVILGIKGFYPDALILKLSLIIISSILLFGICLTFLESGLWLPFIPSILASLLAFILGITLKKI